MPCISFCVTYSGIVRSQTMPGYSMSKLSFWEPLCKAWKQLVRFGGMLPQAVLWISDPLWSLLKLFWILALLWYWIESTSNKWLDRHTCRQYQSPPAMTSYQMVKCRERKRLYHTLDKDNYTTLFIFEPLLAPNLQSATVYYQCQ